MNVKYVSVCYTSESCSPAFLKQKGKLRNVTCKCKKSCILCKNTVESKSHVEPTYSVSGILFTDDIVVKNFFTKNGMT
jgi:hypothetical protein